MLKSEVETDLLRLYGLRAAHNYCTGDEMTLTHFSCSSRLANTIVEVVDLRGIDSYLERVKRDEPELQVQWALVKTAGSAKDSIVVSLGKCSDVPFPSLRAVASSQGQESRKAHASGRDPFETAVSNSLHEQGIENIATSSKLQQQDRRQELFFFFFFFFFCEFLLIFFSSVIYSR